MNREKLATDVEDLVRGLVDQQAMPDTWWQKSLADILSEILDSPPEAEGKELIAYAARYSWLRDQSANQYVHPIVVGQTRSEAGMRYVGPVLGKSLDDAVDEAMAASSRSEG